MKYAALAATLVAAVAGIASADDPSLYTVTDTTLITDCSADIPRNFENAQITIRLFFPAEKNKDLTIGLVRRDGKWAAKNSGGTIGLNPPLQVGPSAPAPPQKGETTITDLTLTDASLKGKLTLRLLPMGWGPKNKEGKQKQVYDEASFDVTLDLKPTGKPVQASDPDPATPGWRKNNARPTGWEFTGTFSAVSAAGEKTEGNALAGVGVLPNAHDFGTEGNAVLTANPAGGMNVTLALGDKRLTESAAFGWAVKPLTLMRQQTVKDDKGETVTREVPVAPPINLAKYSGLRITIASEKRMDHVPLSVGLQEARGAWYRAEGAALLLGKEATFIVPFADFQHAGGFDDDKWPDLANLRAISIGTANGLGVGNVSFTLKKIEAVTFTSDYFKKPPAEAVTITVNPDLRIAHEGSAEVPKGLFGFHEVNLPKEDDEKALPMMKQLNPGFLRKIDHVGFGGPGKTISDEEIKAAQQKRVDAAKASPPDIPFKTKWRIAGDAGDNTMVGYTENLWGRPSWMNAYRDGSFENYLKGVENFYRGAGRDAWVPGDDANAIRFVEVWNEPFMWSRHMNKRDPKFIDPTQHSDQPGDLITNVYSQIYLAAAKGFKSANKHAKIGGPCSAGFIEDHYVNITQFVGKFIDQCHADIDFIAEHHYQGAPESYAAGYDIVTAWADTRHGKRFPIYNTEANDLIDTPNKGEKKEDQPWDPNIDQLNRAYYNAKDIVTMIREIPDIAKGRAMHALWSGYCRNQGETDVYTLMNSLRGHVIACDASDKDVLVLATRQGDAVTVFVLNDSPLERTFTLAGGGDAAGNPAVQTLTYDNGTRLQAATGPTIKLPKRGMATWRFSLPAKGTGLAGKTMDHRRFYAKAVMAEARPDKPLKVPCAVPGGLVVKAKAAYLRVVTDDVQRGEAAVKIGNALYVLPPSRSAGPVIQHVPLNLSDVNLHVQKEAALEFTVAKPEIHNGYDVRSASLVLVTEEP